jgi:hypothetical protein
MDWESPIRGRDQLALRRSGLRHSPLHTHLGRRHTGQERGIADDEVIPVVGRG